MVPLTVAELELEVLRALTLAVAVVVALKPPLLVATVVLV
jgi:hypothetical protein